MNREKTGNLAAATDEDLALALQSGSEQAFDEIVRRHQNRVYSVAYRFMSNREDALDVAQEAFLKVYRKIDTWKPTGGFVPWMLRLTSNQALDSLRKLKRQRHEPLAGPLENAGGRLTEPVAPDAEKTLRAHEIDTAVRAALVVLSPMQRTVFVLRHYEGLMLAEIAAEAGCTVGSVKVHLFRAMKKLQEALGDLRDS